METGFEAVAAVLTMVLISAGLLAERQDFMESLIESKKPDALTSDAESSPYGG